MNFNRQLDQDSISSGTLPSAYRASNASTSSAPELVPQPVPDPVAASTLPVAVPVESLSAEGVMAAIRAEPNLSLSGTVMRDASNLSSLASGSQAPQPTAHLHANMHVHAAPHANAATLSPSAAVRPRVAVIDSAADSHVYLTPLGSVLRIAGIAEIAGTDKSVRNEIPVYLRTIATNIYPGLARMNE